MSAGVRQVLAVVAGAVLAVVIIMLFQAVNSQIFPMPAPVGRMSPEDLKAWIASLPTAAFLVVLLGYGVASCAGAAVAARLGGERGGRAAGAVGAFLLAASLMNLVGLPHPAWFWVANLLLLMGGAWLGFKLGRRPSQAVPAG